ncbi:hypothetical protein [Salinisphaera orenii]|uniref:hypothetical protein n=1 Tax=Salinisphaera orenii TaxID=856731 RepID=UPI000DBE0712
MKRDEVEQALQYLNEQMDDLFELLGPVIDTLISDKEDEAERIAKGLKNIEWERQIKNQPSDSHAGQLLTR